SFGLLAVFTSFVTLLAVVATGRYEFAIGLPKKEKEALEILGVIKVLGLLVSGFYFAGIVFLKDILVLDDRTGFLLDETSYAAPLYIYLIALNSGYLYWFQRLKRYKLISFT